MIHVKDRLVSKLQLSDSCALVLHHTVVLLLLAHFCGGQSKVIGPSQPIVSKVGDDIILPCRLEPAMDAVDLTVEWARPDLDPRFVHLRRDGVELQLEKNPFYKGRTSLSNERLKRGDISLNLSKVKPSDAGTYRCLIPKSGAGSEVELVVGSVSSPDIRISKDSSGVLLECKSAGSYPEPEVFWLDGERNLLPNGPTETVRGPDDLYTVSSRVTVEKGHSNSFTCRVHQKNINQTRETQIHVSDDLFMVQASSAVRITICFAVCFVSIAAVSFTVWKRGQNETKTTDDRSDDSEKMKPLEKRKTELDEKLQKNEEQLTDVRQVITTLTEQKKNLKKQRDELRSLQQEDKVQLEEKMKKLNETTYISKEKKMEKREKIIKDTEDRKRKHEEMLKDIDKLLETTEELVIKMTERKAKLERDKDQIEKDLNEMEREREEMEKKLQEAREEAERKRLLEQTKGEEEKKDPPSTV